MTTERRSQKRTNESTCDYVRVRVCECAVCMCVHVRACVRVYAFVYDEGRRREKGGKVGF